MSVVVNGLVLTLCYPLFLFARNIVRNVNGSGQVPRQRAGVKLLFISKAVAVEDLVEEHGRLVSTKDRQRTDGLDLDALRMYMRWRDTDLEELRGNPNRYRVVVPRDTSEPTDGRVLDGGASYGADPWAAETFLREHEAYGTTPDQLRDGLDAIVAKDVVFVMPGIPLIVSLLLGLATAVTVGDFFALVSQLL